MEVCRHARSSGGLEVSYRPGDRMFEVLERRCLLSGTTVGSVVVDDEARDIIGLDASWKFKKSDVENAKEKNLNDSSWQTVNLPHTWNASDGANGDGNYYRGVGWYRRTFDAPATLAGKRTFLQFEGASTAADVYVNGQKVGSHKGAFATFTFDVTDQLVPGVQNVFAVRVDNADDRSFAPIEGDGVTLGGPDFTIFGGLYRSVNLLVTPQVLISPSDSGSLGVKVDQSDVSATVANVTVRTRVENDSEMSRPVTIQTQILDAAGNVVTQSAASTTVSVGDTEVPASLQLQNPHLWNSTTDPYLYHVVVRVTDTTTAQTDVVVQPLGLRFYKVDPKKGFFLNGKYLNLHGVNYHQDTKGKGWARSDADIDRDVALMVEMGVNFVRLSHYQQSQHAYDAFDKAGIIVWSEIPYIYDQTESSTFLDNLKQQLREEIRQNYNHPSVVFLGLFNGLNDTSTGNEYVSQLQSLAERETPDRITIAAGVTRAGLEADVNTITDTIGYNNYFGWYRGKFTDFGAYVDSYHKKFPNRPLAIAEYGAGASPTQHQVDPTSVVATDGNFHPEEYQTKFHEAQWKQMKARPWLFAKTVFAMFDFASDGRAEGDAEGINDKGMVTYDRQTKKDAFYFYKANWTDTPFVYLTSRRFTDAPSKSIPVKVYSTLDRVTLQVNGKVVSNKAGDSINSFNWGDVKLQAGHNTITVVGSRDGQVYTDTVVFDRPGSGGVTAPLPNGLNVVYFDNPNLSGNAMTRVDPNVNFLWGTGSPDEGVLGPDGFGAVWEGYLQPRFSETYTIYARVNNGVRFFIDGQVVLDKWYAGGTLEYAVKVPLDAGRRHAIRMEYFDQVSTASAQLYWRSASQAREIIPTSQLFLSEH
jgi:beta-galactosidase